MTETDKVGPIAGQSAWKTPFFAVWTGQADLARGQRPRSLCPHLVAHRDHRVRHRAGHRQHRQLFPGIFLGPFAGVLVDRWPRKWILIISDGSTALFTAVLSILFLAGRGAALACLFDHIPARHRRRSENPAMISTTPLMVPRNQLSRVAGMNSTLQGVLSFATPPFGRPPCSSSWTCGASSLWMSSPPSWPFCRSFSSACHSPCCQAWAGGANRPPGSGRGIALHLAVARPAPSDGHRR